MPITLHPDAARNFNAKGTELASRAVGLHMATGRSPTFRPDHYVSKTLRDSDLVPGSFLRTELRTPLGVPHGITITREGKPVSLDADAHAALDRLADQMSRTRQLRDVVGPRRLAELIHEWLWFRRWSGTQEPVVDHVVREVSALVADVTVWLPIHGLYIEHDFILGGVGIRTMTRAMTDAHYNKMIAHARPEDVSRVEARAGQIRKRLQGGAAAVLTVSAEASRAVEVATERSRGPLTILRFFSPAALVPQARSYLTLLGGENIEQRTYFTTHADEIVAYSEEISEKYQEFSVTLDRSRIADVLGGGRHFDRLFSLEIPNDFQEIAQGVLETFSRATLYRTVSEKLIHMLVALESLLLRNDNEPIQDNLGYRIAFAHETSAEERRQKLAAVKGAYTLRSKFLHHGIAVRPEADDLEALTRFTQVAWTFLFELPRLAFGFASRTAFIDELETRRLAARRIRPKVESNLRNTVIDETGPSVRNIARASSASTAGRPRHRRRSRTNSASAIC